MRLPDMAVRCLAWLCLFLTLWPGFVVAADAPAPSAVPVVTNISGAVVVRTGGGVSHDVLASRIVHSGDTLVTGVDSLAALSLADVGKIQLGPGSTATASATATSLGMSLDSGSLCAQAQSPAISVKAGPLSIAAGDETAIFSLLRTPESTTIAVYQGQISTTLSGKNSIALHAGEAAVSSHNGSPVQVPIETVQPSFAALKCPDDAIIARAVPSAAPAPSGGSHGGGGGGFIGILLGLGAIAALAGGHGGGGGGSSPPTSPPTIGPGVLSVNQPSLSFIVDGASQQFTATESGYTGPINAVSANTGVATVTPASGAGPSVTFTVTPTGSSGTSTTITVTDNHGGSKTVSVSVAAAGTLTVSTPSLSFLVGGSTQTFTASESGYGGAINASSDKNSVATVTPASGSGPGPVTFTVTPGASGSANITVTDDHGGSKIVSITVTPPGSIVVAPNNLTFVLGGASQTFTASESSYTGPITAASNDTTVATVAGSGTGPGPVTFTVAPTGAGTTTITVTGGDGPGTVKITVIGPITTAPTSLTFLGTTTPQTFTATDPFFGGTLSASIDKPAVATVAPVGSTTGPGPVTFKVTPVAAGNATVTISDTFGGSATLSVSISTGGLLINPTALTFTVGGANQTFTGSEADYAGTITAKSSNIAKATVSPGSGTGPGPIIFTVSAVAAGTPSIAVADDHGGLDFVNLTITGPMSAAPPSLTFSGTTAPQTINVTDPNYFGSIGASSTDITVATVTSPGVGPSASFSVTPVNRGTATINFSDANGGNTSVGVTVIAGPLTVSTSSVSLVGIGSSTGFTASETDYTGPISAVSDTPGVATVAPASGGGPGPVPFTITATGTGTATITVSDDHGGSKTISVSVLTAPTVAPGSLTFSDVGPPNAQSVSVSEPSYTGTFSISNNSCGSIANVGPVSGTGPSASVPVFGLDQHRKRRHLSVQSER